MPIVLASHEGKSAPSGHTYDDRTGISYEYPKKQYESLVTTGERFLYHFPKLGYVGAGVVGEIRPSVNAGLLVCDVLDYESFPEPVSLMAPTGYYWEADVPAGKLNVYWSQGVRPIQEDAFDGVILASGSKPAPAPAKTVPAKGFPSTDHTVEVDRYAMETAMGWATDTYPGCLVLEMPHNNPGYDIRVSNGVDAVRFIEVKGSQANEPLFFMSEGQREFSVRHADRYTLVSVYGINLKTTSHGAVLAREGEVTVANSELEPMKWRGRMFVE